MFMSFVVLAVMAAAATGTVEMWKGELKWEWKEEVKMGVKVGVIDGSLTP